MMKQDWNAIVLLECSFLAGISHRSQDDAPPVEVDLRDIVPRSDGTLFSEGEDSY